MGAMGLPHEQHMNRTPAAGEPRVNRVQACVRGVLVWHQPASVGIKRAAGTR
ncbi:hypothetical protein LMG28690_02124 [Paraburkholderia caffeinilytica]|nr:hypothetical protein LMG28690_02124 [Paraburkholderia caffeinilytica]